MNPLSRFSPARLGAPLLSTLVTLGLLGAGLHEVRAAPPLRANATLEHEFTLLVDIPAKGEHERAEVYRSRRKKTQDEVLSRLLRRYNTIDVRDLKGLQQGTSSSLRMSMRAKRSPGFIQAVALGEGRVALRPVKEQDELWAMFANPVSEESSALMPDTIRVIDTSSQGFVLESEDAAALKKFISKFVLSKSSLHLVRGPGKRTWRTLWLGEALIDSDAVEGVTLDQSAHTGTTFGQLKLTAEGVKRWQALTQDADAPVVLVIDEEPIAVVHRPVTHTLLAERSDKARSIAFGCDPTWVGPGDIEECTTLAAARASAFIPLKVALSEATARP